MSPTSFRQAEVADADAIAVLHVASWRETYSGILDQFLDELSVEARSAMWRGVLGGFATRDGTNVFVAENGNDIVGFGACGRQRDEGLREQGFDGEIGALYVLKPQQRSGIGKALMRLMAQSLVANGRKGASLWVIRENIRARCFYELLGAALIGEKVDQVSDTTIVEVAYGWSDLKSLAS